MDIPENVLQNIVKQSVNVGDVYLVELNQSDGITPRIFEIWFICGLPATEDSTFGKVISREL